MANRYAPDRRVRHHRRPAHGRAGGHGRLDRLPVRAVASTRRRCSRRCSTPSAAAASRSRPLLDGAARKQLYLPDTNVLLTRFLDTDGVAEVSDFMPVEDAGHAHNLVRRAKTVRGEVRFQMRCEPRFDYARATTRPSCASDDRGAVRRAGGRRRAGAAPARRRCRCGSRTARRVAEFTLRADESAWFVLEVVLAGEPSPSRAARLRARRVQGRRSTSGAAGSTAAPTGAAGARW